MDVGDPVLLVLSVFVEHWLLDTLSSIWCISWAFLVFWSFFFFFGFLFAYFSNYHVVSYLFVLFLSGFCPGNLNLCLQPIFVFPLAPKEHTFDYLLYIYLIHTFEITFVWLLLSTSVTHKHHAQDPNAIVFHKSALSFLAASGSNTIILTLHSEYPIALSMQLVIENCQFCSLRTSPSPCLPL